MKKHLIAVAALMLLGVGCASSPKPAAAPSSEPSPATTTSVAPSEAPTVAPTGAGTDADHDGLFYEDEMTRGTDPEKADTDGDGLADGDEIHVFGTDPLKADTDADGYSDGSELKNGYDSLVAGRKLEPDDIEAIKAKYRVNFLHQPTYETISGGPIL